MTHHLSAPRIRVELVTNQRLLRTGLQMLIEASPKLCLVHRGEPENHAADVIVFDAEHPAGSAALGTRQGNPPIVVLASDTDTDAATSRASALGASAIVNSYSAPDTLVDVIFAVHRRARIDRS